MLWLTWRQHRLQILVTAGLIAVFGVALLMHGNSVEAIVAEYTGDPAGLEALLGDTYSSAYQVLTWLPIMPAVIGLFWGTPVLSREFEKQTHLLAWTQSVTRRRWIGVKLGSLTAVTALFGLAVGAIVSAWLGTFGETRYAEPFADPGLFGCTGVAAGAWWAFAFVLGASAGAFVRRMLPAMAVTIAVFVLVMMTIFTHRDSYAEPERLPVEAVPPVGSRIAINTWVGPDGVEVPPEQSPSVCQNAPNDEYLDCVADAGYRNLLYVYSPNMYWRFQWTEAGLLLAAAALIGGAAVYWVGRRPV